MFKLKYNVRRTGDVAREFVSIQMAGCRTLNSRRWRTRTEDVLEVAHPLDAHAPEKAGPCSFWRIPLDCMTQ
jgi:hypothetical protein